ncbi:MAG: phospholipid carrier-dependent glycosyltransferase [Thermoleophilia bacterium]
MTAVVSADGGVAAGNGGLTTDPGRRVALILWAVLLLQGMIFALIQPVWSRVDEAQHFDYVQYLVENRSLPVEGQTFISREAIDVSLQENQWGWRRTGAFSTPLNLDPGQWITVPAGLSDQEREKWVRHNLWHFNYEAMQPPLYYAINAPLYAALPDDSLVRLYAMRLLAALLASAMVPITYLAAREVLPGNRLVVYGAPVVVLLTQGYALNMSQVTNDALAIPLAAATLLVLLRQVGRGPALKTTLLAGVLIGASLLAKLTTIFLLPVALLALALPVAFKREQPWRSIRHAGMMLGVAGLIVAPWMVHNLSVYGDATGAAAARPLMSSFFWSPAISTDSLRFSELLPTYWFGEPVFPFPFWTWAWIAVGPAMVIALAGLAYYFLGPERRLGAEVRIRVLFMVLTFVIGVGVNLLLPFGSGIGGVPGRYLYPLMPVGAFLLMFGIDRLLKRERAQFLAELLLIWLVVWESLNFLAYVKSI